MQPSSQALIRAQVPELALVLAGGSGLAMDIGCSQSSISSPSPFFSYVTHLGPRHRYEGCSLNEGSAFKDVLTAEKASRSAEYLLVFLLRLLGFAHLVGLAATAHRPRDSI